ncbi:hypothetical protein Fuma_06664 [Fuerstiella marisgermanici]|uniref:Uncharacterized protein n=1 Tax=Fuerstiella marisgermanici TaxID=1891926 RepID=A0A1P8WSF4_9PLAN|nr:hypothetical protein Fuma_06664 [Fuerstiella marisgermanici]
MNDEASQNPYRPPESRDTPDVNTPGPAAMMLVGFASVAAGIFAFFGTCYGVMIGIYAAGRSQSAWASIILAALGILLPIPATFFATRYVRRTLTARFTERDDGSKSDD